MDELARDLERLLDKASPDLPAEVRNKELKFHLMNTLPDKVSLQLKLLPPQTYAQTILKATELLLIYRCADKAEASIHQITKDERLDKLEAAVNQVSEQLTALSTQGQTLRATSHVKPPRTHRFKDIQCYNCRKRTFSEKLLEIGKRKRGHPYTLSRGCSPLSVNARTIDGLPVISQLTNTTKTACVSGKLNDHQVQVLLDSGASCSVMQAGHTPQTNLIEPSSITLINVDGRKLTPLGTTTAKLDLGIMTVNHTMIVVEKLSTPVILGCDFLTKHGIILDFNTGTFNTATSAQEGKIHLSPTHSCMLVLDDDHPEAMPSKATSSLPGTLDMPTGTILPSGKYCKTMPCYSKVT